MGLNLHNVASIAIGAVNPNRAITWRQSNGYTTDASGQQIPSYTTRQLQAQIQALSSSDLAKLDGLNVQSNMLAIYLSGHERGQVRVDARGGDLFVIDGKNWLAVQVLENWSRWTKLALVLQNG